MRKDFLISTTDNIECGTIKAYIDTVCANVVVGTNVFSDFAASFTDFFGGRSGTYQRKLEMIYEEAKKSIGTKARAVGANAVVGLKIDFDQISGKNMSMFMVSICGTACVVDYDAEEENSHTSIRTVPQEDLEREIKKNEIAAQINSGSYLKEEWINFMQENPQIEIVGSLIDKYIEFGRTYNFADFTIRYLSLFSDGEIDGIVYDKYISAGDRDAVWKIIHECRLFNPSRVLDICKQDVHSGISLLDAWRNSYSEEHLADMERLYGYLCNLPDTGRIETVKGGMLGKDKEKFICEKGHKNPSDAEFCNTCNRNIKGLTPGEVKKIGILKDRIHMLKVMFEKV